MSHIELCGVSFAHGDRLLFNNLNLSFARNRVTAILGHSGAGKSTLLRLVLGLHSPDNGRVLIAGLPRQYPTSIQDRFRFGYVIQGNGLFPHLTVSENISLPGRMTGLSLRVSAVKVRSLMKIARLPLACYNKFPYQLSNIEQMRVLICRAYFLDPPVLLMDEPFGSLDTDLRRGLHLEFQQMQRNYPRTVLIVTHDRAEAELLADDVLVLDSGRVQQFGPTHDVLQHPANANVQHVLQATASA
jgi:osmoprotectant transport system ATP-binding protein